MKKIVFSLLAVLALSACSKNESDITPINGQYVGHQEYTDEYNDYSITFCLTIENGLCTDFVIYTDAERFNYYRPADISTKGSYPKYTYRINDFTMQARFTDMENFTANIFGALCTHREIDYGAIGEAYSAIELEATDVNFKLDNTQLDTNGDGILDSKQ